MRKWIGVVGVLLILILVAIWQFPKDVVLYNDLTGSHLEITNEGLIESLLTPLESIDRDNDRIKTPFTNKLVIYKGIIPVRTIYFAMPSMFDGDKVGQVIYSGNPYQVDITFYDVLRKIEKEKEISFDTL